MSYELPETVGWHTRNPECKNPHHLSSMIGQTIIVTDQLVKMLAGGFPHRSYDSGTDVSEAFGLSLRSFRDH